MHLSRAGGGFTRLNDAKSEKRSFINSHIVEQQNVSTGWVELME